MVEPTVDIQNPVPGCLQEVQRLEPVQVAES